MKPLSEQAAEHLQEQYRQTLDYALKNLNYKKSRPFSASRPFIKKEMILTMIPRNHIND